MNIIDKIKTFLKEVRLEVKKVNWLTRKELTNYTLMVIGFILAMAVFFGVLDFSFGQLLNHFVLSQ
jgi:preprotein translocase subunit SecE